MEITLKMKINEQDFELKVNMTLKAGRIYRQQFQRDLVKDMSEIYKIANPSVYDGLNLSGIDANGKSEEEIYEQILSKVDLGQLMERRNKELDYQHTEQASQIIWAFAKNADDDLPGYEDWIDGFDFVMPVKEIVSTLYEAWSESAKPTIEIKN